MFLVRIAFWLIIIVLLLPTDGKQQSEVYGTAQAAVKDVSGFCDRNPDACVKGMNIFNMLVQKAQFGASMLVGFVQEQSAGGETVQTQALAPDPLAPDSLAPDALAPEPLEAQSAPATGPDPISWDPAEDVRSQNTLRSEDLEAQWGGEASDPGV
jgi:hypothetical protein